MTASPTIAARPDSTGETTAQPCPLCQADGGEVLVRNASLRIVRIDDPDYPGFCRVVWNAHVREMTDLSEAERARMMDAVWRVEAVIRDIMLPDKVNLASLGNQVPHLHWHVIPRWHDDRNFPDPIWVVRDRPGQKSDESARNTAERLARASRLSEYLRRLRFPADV